MGNMTLVEIFKINPIVIGILFICSVLLVAYLFERVWAVLRVGDLDSATAERVKQHVRQGQIKEAINVCARSKNFTAHALEVALNASSLPREEMENIFALYRMKLQALLNKNLSVFGTLAFTGPLIGLLGTVMGVIRAFRDLALSGSGGPSIVAAGIAEALFTTAGGIGVAVVAAVVYNIFTAVTRSKIQQFDQLSQEIAILVYTGSEKGTR
jgi:biopolymer transport protein ExbB